MTRLALLTLTLAACAACSDGGNSTADAAPPDPCMPQMTFTGEYVDWDSTPAMFMGIPGAVFTHRGDPSKTDTTAPNGRFDLNCIPAQDGFVDIAPMAGSNYVGGTIVVNKAVIQSQPIQSYRSFTTTRAAQDGFDAGLAHVYVHVHGGMRTVSSSAAAGIQKTFDGTTWSDGNTGSDIYLGNISGTSTTLMVTGGNALGAGMIPLTPGSITYVTLVAR